MTLTAAELIKPNWESIAKNIWFWDSCATSAFSNFHFSSLINAQSASTYKKNIWGRESEDVKSFDWRNLKAESWNHIWSCYARTAKYIFLILSSKGRDDLQNHAGLGFFFIGGTGSTGAEIAVVAVVEEADNLDIETTLVSIMCTGRQWRVTWKRNSLPL